MRTRFALERTGAECLARIDVRSYSVFAGVAFYLELVTVIGAKEKFYTILVNYLPSFAPLMQIFPLFPGDFLFHRLYIVAEA